VSVGGVEIDGQQHDGTRPSSNQRLLQQHDVLSLHGVWLSSIVVVVRRLVG
jgi:hypothetical protein